MIDTDFATIERSLGIKLPSAYRRVMSAYPFHDCRPADAYIPDSAQYVCNLNQQILADSVYAKSWRPEHFAIGTTWGGDAHVLDASSDDSPVYKFDQEEHSVTTLAACLDDWIAILSQWYMGFDEVAVAAEYGKVTAAIDKAGFFCTKPEPMDGWHRITVMSTRGGGDSFWVALINHAWFAGTWGGNIFRISENVPLFCVAWLTTAACGALKDFIEARNGEYNFEVVTDVEFESMLTE